ncbi:cell division protein FtsZ [Flavobacterium sp. I3-2]|uniref:cell division protein FtsZ n=1 Tax=Flavobacterium sp. I3-2 TaxID=2748319 RepID=UPI0015ACB3E9|nr:cell division protein FtsZ [Flavobacterium sp. I3-2]
MDNTFENITFDLPKNQSNVIKVIGVGGGGSNAINHMFSQGIKGVDFVVCNTDAQALQNSTVPTKIQLGVALTEGLGAGANPDVGQQSALESIEEIEQLLDTNTKMVFITAGMGGGTGTGAAPVIAQLSKERDILTVGIVTIPFQFEGKVRQEQALRGVEKLRKVVDSLIVINNNKLREVYGNLGFKAGFSKADEVLATASRGIAEVITHHYTQNIDLKDAKTVLSNSGTAIMGSSLASGENRAKEAIVSALDSPLLNDNKITGAKNVLLLIVSGENEITIDEIGEINDHIQMEAGHNANIIMGVGEDETLGDSIAVTIIATGFNVEQQQEIVSSSEPNKIIHVLGDEQRVTANLTQPNVPTFSAPSPEQPLQNNGFSNAGRIVYGLEDDLQITSNSDVEKKTIVQTTNPVAHAVATPVVEQVVNPAINEQPQFEIKQIKTQDIRDIQVIDPQFIIVKPKPVIEEPAIQFTFDIHQQEREFEGQHEMFSNQELNFFTNNEPEMVIPVQEEKVEELKNPNEVIRYSLDDYMEVEEKLTKKVAVEEMEDDFGFTVRTETSIPNSIRTSDEISPIDLSINDILKGRAEERKRKMKDFNHKFNNVNAQLNDLEKEPAYKRMGVDLYSNTSSQTSRMSLGTDSNNDLQLRSNNSFLHDNVD